ncbi:MAG: hypothetical protein AB7V50_06400 [Vampirovibrionia bacterium]
MNKKKGKILVGVQEIAGFANAYAQGLRELGYNADFVTYFKHNFDYPYDKYMPVGKYNKEMYLIAFLNYYFKHFMNFIRIVFNYDYYIFLFGYTLLPYNIDIPLLKIFKKKVIMVYLGDDIRKRKADSDLKAGRRIRLVEKYVDAIFAQKEYAQRLTKDYYHVFAPIDTVLWNSSEKIIKDNKPLIVHAPSCRNVKGTEYVIAAIEKLKLDGFCFEFKLLENLSNKDVQSCLRDSHIVIDQLMIGWHGRLAIEAMALRNVVLCYLNTDYLEDIENLPIINVTKENLYYKLKELLENQNRISIIADESRMFVEKHHDMNKVVKKFIEIFNL